MPAQLRDIFLGVGSNLGNIWFPDQKQPLEHLPWASLHHELKYFIQEQERVGDLIIQSFAECHSPVQGQLSSSCSCCQGPFSQRLLLIHSLPSQTSSTPIFPLRDFSDSTRQTSWGRAAWRKVSDKHWGPSVPANVTHWDCAREAPAATGSQTSHPPPMTLPGRLPELSLENLLLPSIPFSSGVFPKADAFSPQVISYKPLERTTSGTSCGSSIHSKSTEWPQSHPKHSECHNVNTEITSHHDFYVNWCSLFASGEIEMLGITSRFSGLWIQFAEGTWERGGIFFFPSGINIACLEHLRGWQAIILDHSLCERQRVF